jgi:hypothetical protein
LQAILSNFLDNLDIKRICTTEWANEGKTAFISRGVNAIMTSLASVINSFIHFNAVACISSSGGKIKYRTDK